MAETNGVKWHVLPQSQRLTTTLTGVGTGFQDVWEVPFEIDSGPAQGTRGTARIPAAQYNEQTVMATIGELVTRMHAIQSL